VPRIPPTTASTIRSPSVSVPVAHVAASAAASAMFSAWKTKRTFRRSYRSARTPAGSAKTRFGIVFRKPIRPSVAAEPPSRSTT
jgi:hypothetical protein